MKSIISLFLLAGILVANSAVVAEQTQKAKYLEREIEVESILNSIERNYAPLQLKKKTIGFDWLRERQAFRSRLLNAPTAAEFYHELSLLLGSFQDAHVSMEIPSSYVLSIPVQFIYLDGKTIVSHIEADIGESASEMEVGDELISIDGKTPDELRDAIAPYIGIGPAEANKEILTLSIAKIEQKRAIPVDVVRWKISDVALESAETGERYTVRLKWVGSGAPLVDRPLPKYSPDPDEPSEQLWGQRRQPSQKPLGPVTKTIRKMANLHAKLVNTMIPKTALNADTLVSRDWKPEGWGTKLALGHAQPLFKMPSDFNEISGGAIVGTIVGLSGLYAGKFTYNGKKVGFIRIPSYVPASIEFSIFGLRYVIGKLEKETDYLIIDQTNNPGGYVLFSDWVVGSLVGRLDYDKHMKFAVRPTQTFVRTYAQLVQMIEENENNMFGEDIHKKYLKPLQDEYEIVATAYKSHEGLSEPISLALTSELMQDVLSHAFRQLLKENLKGVWPYLQTIVMKWLGVDIMERQVYTKPVYMVTNGLDFSGGDATPATLQDYGRVKIVGTPTAGAGGSVAEFTSDLVNSFKFRLTNSLMVRSGKTKFVENIGVQPDIPFHFTVEDFRTEFNTTFYRLMSVIPEQ